MVMSMQAYALTTICLRSEIQASRSLILLNDVADITSENISTLKQFQEISLGRVPKDRKETMLSKREIQSWVQQLTTNKTPVQWECAENIRIVQTFSGFPNTGNFSDGVFRDSWITLTVSSGLVKVETKVLALQSGSVGQYIRVKKDNAIRSVLAKVTGKNTVEIVE